MSCSCPDWAVPCKHIAAVIYIIANEIDKNPFIVFKLHGLDIFKEIEKKGFASNKNETGIPLTQSYLNEKLQKTKINGKSDAFKAIDFSSIPDLKENILSLLDEDALFYSKVFKPVLKKAYNATSKGINKFLINTADDIELDFTANY